jgi:hypothetical protein
MNFVTGRLETVAGSAPNIYGVPGPAVGASSTAIWTIWRSCRTAIFYSDSVDSTFSGSTRRKHHDGRRIRTFFGGSKFGPVLGANFGPIAFERIHLAVITSRTPARSVTSIRLASATMLPVPKRDFSGDGGPATDAALLQPWDARRRGRQSLHRGLEQQPHSQDR